MFEQLYRLWFPWGRGGGVPRPLPLRPAALPLQRPTRRFTGVPGTTVLEARGGRKVYLFSLTDENREEEKEKIRETAS